MCKASLHAKSRTSKEGETLAVGITHGGLGAFHSPGESALNCIACVENGAELTITNIPAKAQQAYLIGKTENAIFVETEGSDSHYIHDLLLFPGHPDLPAIPVAHIAGAGVRAQLHLAEGRPDVIEDLKRRAIEPMDVFDTPTIDDVAAQRVRLLDHVG